MGSFSLYRVDTIIIVSILFVLLIIVYLSGIKLRKYLEKTGKAHETIDLGVVEGSLLGLFAFLLGFTFNMSGARFDDRRQTIIAEANTIGTAILRADLFPDTIRNKMQEHFKRYVEYRLAYFDAGIDEAKLNRALTDANSQSNQIWALVSQLVKTGQYSDATRQMVPALNDMIDAVTTRDAAKNARVPESIIVFLIALSICSGFIVGYGTKGAYKNYIAGLVLIIMICLSIYLIIDLDRPRRGLIKTESANAKIVELRALFD